MSMVRRVCGVVGLCWLGACAAGGEDAVIAGVFGAGGAGSDGAGGVVEAAGGGVAMEDAGGTAAGAVATGGLSAGGGVEEADDDTQAGGMQGGGTMSAAGAMATGGVVPVAGAASGSGGAAATPELDFEDLFPPLSTPEERIPAPDNIPECPTEAPADPLGPCLGVPVYATCNYGTYACICDWVHWICFG